MTWPCCFCGMQVDAQAQLCPKCDTRRGELFDDSLLTVDVGHAGQRVPDTRQALEGALLQAMDGGFGRLRVITGAGAIHDEAAGILSWWKHQHRIRHWSEEGRGAFLVLR